MQDRAGVKIVPLLEFADVNDRADIEADAVAKVEGEIERLRGLSEGGDKFLRAKFDHLAAGSLKPPWQQLAAARQAALSNHANVFRFRLTCLAILTKVIADLLAVPQRAHPTPLPRHGGIHPARHRRA